MTVRCQYFIKQPKLFLNLDIIQRDCTFDYNIEQFQLLSQQQIFASLSHRRISSMINNKLFKKPSINFIFQNYIQAQNQVQYIQNLLHANLLKCKLQSGILCMNQLNDILIQMMIPLKIRQLHELYLYATHQKFQSKLQSKERVVALMNNERRKTDFNAVSKWLNENIKKGNIKFARNRIMSEAYMNHNRSLNESALESKTKREKRWRLPPIRGSSNQKLTQQLKYLVEIFQEMEKQRQNSGLIPINLQSDDQELDLSSANIPYDPQLYELNKNLAKLRIKAQDRLTRIIQLARDEPRIRMKLEQAIQKFQRVRIEANQKVGRIGSMKAQKRLIENRKRQQNRLRNLDLGQQQDILKAAKLYSLLSIQQRKPNRLIS